MSIQFHWGCRCKRSEERHIFFWIYDIITILNMGLNMAMIMAKYTKYKFGKCATVSAWNQDWSRLMSVSWCLEKVDVCELQQDWIGERVLWQTLLPEDETNQGKGLIGHENWRGKHFWTHKLKRWKFDPGSHWLAWSMYCTWSCINFLHNSS